MSITSASTQSSGTKRGRHPNDDNNKEEQSSTKKRPTLLSRIGHGLGGLWPFGGFALPGIQSHGGIVDNNIGNNGHEAVYANEDDATNHQSQLDVNAGANIPTGAGALRDRTNATNNRCPDAPIKSLERYLYGRRLCSSNEADVEENNYLGSVDSGDSTDNDEEDEEDDFNDALQQYTTKLRQQSAAKLGFQEQQLLQEEEEEEEYRIEVAEEIRREFDQKEHEEEKERLRQITEDSNWERGARDAVDEQDRQEEVDGYNELQHQKEEEEQHEMRQAELEWSLREWIDDGSDSSDEQAEQETDDAELASEQQRDEDDGDDEEEDENEATDEAYARALQHRYDDEQSRLSQQEAVDAALALALQNEDSPHAREISSSTNPSETFEFKDPQQEVEEQCGGAVLAAMAVEEEDEDMTEEVAMEALVDLRSDDDEEEEEEEEEDASVGSLVVDRREIIPGRPFGMTQRRLTFDDVSLDEEDNSIDYQHVICDKCQALRVFEDLNKIGDRNLCSICEENSSFIPPEAETTCETGEDNSSASLPANRRRPTFEDLKADGYDLITHVRETKTMKYPGYVARLGVSVDSKKSKMESKKSGSAQAALLEFECLLLAQESEMSEDGIITSWKGLRGDPMPFQQFKDDLSHDVELMKRMPAARKHLGRSDLRGEGDLAVTAIRAVANNLSGELNQHWKCDKRVLEKIINILEEVANGTRSAFPWEGTSFGRSYDFPSQQEWRADFETVQLQLGNRDLKKRAKTEDIVRRLEPALYLFAHESTDYGFHGPPQNVTKAQRTCAHWECALLAQEAMFQGLLFDGECGNESFIDYIPQAYHEDPTTMPQDKKREAVCEFLVDVGVFPEWYKPNYLRAEEDSEERYDLNASPEEIQQMKEEIAKKVGTLQNLERLREERRIVAAKNAEMPEWRDAHVDRLEKHGGDVFDLVEEHHHHRKEVGISFNDFTEEYLERVQQIPGLNDFTLDESPVLRSFDESRWMNHEKRYYFLGQLKMEFIGWMVPLEIESSNFKQVPGECVNALCDRNSCNYPRGCFQGSHVDDVGKANDPCKLSYLRGTELLDEVGKGLDHNCGPHHDRAKEKRSFDLAKEKYHLLWPHDDLGREDGKDMNELMQDRVNRLKYTSFIMELYARGWMGTHKKESGGDYNTLRTVALAHFGTLVDDLTAPSASDWNGCNQRTYVFQALRSIVQNQCGVCAAATAAGTDEAQNKEPHLWEEDDYACLAENYNFRKYPFVERQANESDHTVAVCATDGAKRTSMHANIFAMLDEIFHAPYHCFFCHKVRTANQKKNNSWRTGNRDYTWR